jgi:hypothetical protein
MMAYMDESSTSFAGGIQNTLDRNLHGDILNAANVHLKAAFFNRRSEAGSLESINTALNSIPIPIDTYHSKREALGPQKIYSKRVVSLSQ